MTTFVRIYGLIVVMGIISGIIDKVVLKKKQDFLSTTLIYCVEYYISVAFGRAVVGSGNHYLSYSFYGKELRGYIKVALLIMAVYLINSLLLHLLKDKYELWLKNAIGFFAVIGAFHIVFWNQPKLNTSCIIALIAAILSLLYIIWGKDKTTNDKLGKQEYALIGVVFLLFSIMHYIVGPAEIYAYSKEDFIYGYDSLAPHLWVGAVLFTGIFTLLIVRFSPKWLCRITCIAISAYNIIGYVQFFFLNGQMSSLDGSEQKWEMSQMIINAIIWLMILTILVLLAIKYKESKKIIIGASIYIILIQLVSYVYLFTSMDIMEKKEEQVIEDGVLELGQENIIVLILDAYDTQEIEMVRAEKNDYLKPLNDFTYYSNMSSRYYYTDFSLPFLLTGGNRGELDIEDKSGTYLWYDDDCFLKDIAGYGYDIQVLTEKKYVDKFTGENPVKNYSTDAKCVLDTEKSLSLYADAVRYRNMPFCLKRLYRYGIYDFINVISETNIYRMGTDDKFDEMVTEQGIKDCGIEKAYRFYHLYGAHAPFYMTEDARMDYSTCNPMAQFKGSLKVVYDYIDELKKSGLYDESTIVITADHGLNPGQVEALRDAGISCDEDKSNPIFFIKQKNEKHNDMIIDTKPVSHDQIFDTIMKCIDSDWNNKYYGTVWE